MKKEIEESGNGFKSTKTDKKLRKFDWHLEINLPNVQKLSNQGLIVIKYYADLFIIFIIRF